MGNKNSLQNTVATPVNQRPLGRQMGGSHEKNHLVAGFLIPTSGFHTSSACGQGSFINNPSQKSRP